MARANTSETERTLLDAVAASRGHFVYESGHHGDLWLDLDTLFLDAQRTRIWAAALAEQARIYQPEFVCGPLTGGAFLAQFLAAELRVGFVYAERFVSEVGLAQYKIPEPLRKSIQRRPLLLVDDAVNAGSAWRSTLADLGDCGSEIVGFAALLTLSEAASQIAEQYGVPLFALASLECRMWTPEACPLCESEAPLIDHFVR